MSIDWNGFEDDIARFEAKPVPPPKRAPKVMQEYYARLYVRATRFQIDRAFGRGLRSTRYTTKLKDYEDGVFLLDVRYRAKGANRNDVVTHRLIEAGGVSEENIDVVRSVTTVIEGDE